MHAQCVRRASNGADCDLSCCYTLPISAADDLSFDDADAGVVLIGNWLSSHSEILTVLFYIIYIYIYIRLSLHGLDRSAAMQCQFGR